jgi:WD40 repeat protein
VDHGLAAGKSAHAGRLRVWDVASGQELIRRDSDGGSFFVYQFSPDGRTLATSLHADSDVTEAALSRVSVWDLTANTEVLGLDVLGFIRLAFSPDGRRLAGSLASSPLESGEAELRVWDVATGKVVLRRTGFGGRIGGPAFDGNGTRLAVAVGEWGGGGKIHLLSAVNGEELCTPLEGHSGQVQQLAFSPDGRRLVSSVWAWRLAASEVKVWDVAGGRELLTVPTKGTGSFAFSPDGRRLFWVGGPSEGPDAEVQVWDATPLADEQPAAAWWRR